MAVLVFVVGIEFLRHQEYLNGLFDIQSEQVKGAAECHTPLNLHRQMIPLVAGKYRHYHEVRNSVS